jgi:hypothetical protein
MGFALDALVFLELLTFLPALGYGIFSLYRRRVYVWEAPEGGKNRPHDLKAQNREFRYITFLVVGGWVGVALFGVLKDSMSYADLGLLLAVLLLFLGSWYPLIFARTFAPEHPSVS